jgi:hypothetical protein
MRSRTVPSFNASFKGNKTVHIGLGVPFSVNDDIYWAGPPVFGPMEMQCIGLGLPFSVMFEDDSQY